MHFFRKIMRRKRILYLIGAFIFIGVIIVLIVFKSIFGIKIQTEKKNVVLFVPTGATYSQVIDSLNTKVLIKDPKLFDWIARKKHYPSHIKPGKYVIERDIKYISLVNLLRSGRQTPVKVTFSSARTLNDLAFKVGEQIEADSAKLMSFFSDPENYRKDGFTKENIISVFIPNTYQFFWNTDAERFYLRMLKEYKDFWNDQRMDKAKEIGLNPTEVSILASIIDDEVAKPDEKTRIAGVYLNRLKRGIPLQACPTIKFALNDFTITRILYKHLHVESPYNTYKYKGFPPGPIGCPSVESIDAVLNAEKHDYIFFAAKPDFSGYHNFSRTLKEHNRNAAIYQKELNKRKIFR